MKPALDAAREIVSVASELGLEAAALVVERDRKEWARQIVREALAGRQDDDE